MTVRLPPISKRRARTSVTAADLVDERLAQYINWLEDADAVTEAYNEWSAASPADRAWRYSAYLAALELEQSSAGSYAAAVGKCQHRG
jgi:hypothetical protein